METLTVTKYEKLNNFATELKANGFTIISSYDENSDSYNSYFNFYRDGFFGYVQKDTFEGYIMSTVNKPCKKYGTGHRYINGYDILTKKNALNCLEYSKRLINSYNEIKNYSSVDEFINSKITMAKVVV